eukprot:Nk52_evm1s2620 gene=Nk52_evmTU1s2620
MFTELNSLLNWSDTQPPVGQIITIGDCVEAEGGFLLSHFMSMFLRRDSKSKRPAGAGYSGESEQKEREGCVCLVGFAQSKFHYTSVGKKLGVNMAKMETEGRFDFIDGMARLLQKSDNNNKEKNVIEGSTILFSSFFRDLYLDIKKIIDRNQKEGKSTCLVLDDVSIPAYIGVPYTDVVDFLSYCAKFTTHTNCLVSLVHVEDDLHNILQEFHHPGDNLKDHIKSSSSSSSSRDHNNTAIFRALRNLSTLVLVTCGLDSGYSKDVHGQLLIQYVGMGVDGRGINHLLAPTQHVHYKCTEHNVSFFARGLAKALL